MKATLEEEISHEELASLTNVIKTKYGIDFTNYEPKSLRRGFAKLISKHEMNSLLDLWSRILSDRAFFKGIIDDLTVNLTELFRNPEIWKVIKERVLVDFKKQEKVRMWHAGCSTGEEVYSMAAVLAQSYLLYKSETLATDLSSRVLQKAEAGIYPNLLLNKYKKGLTTAFPDAKFEDIFHVKDTGVVVRERYKKHIRFSRHNLVSDPVSETFDIIFCRNVMIYFDNVLKMKVLQNFYDRLSAGGFLIIGYYDMLPRESKDLFELYDATTRVYKKRV